MAEIKNLFDDITKLGTNAASAMFESSQEFSTKIKDHLKGLLSSMNMVTREEFDVVKQLAEKNALENIDLKKRIAELETKSKNKKQ